MPKKSTKVVVQDKPLNATPEPVQQAQPVQPDPSNKEMFDELASYLHEAASALDSMKDEKDADELNNLKFDFYSLLLGVSDEIKDILKVFRKKYKITEKQVRAAMEEEDSAGEEPATEPADA